MSCMIGERWQSSSDHWGQPIPQLSAEMIRVFISFAPLSSERVWHHAQVLLWGAMWTPGVRTVSAALRAMGLAMARHSGWLQVIATGNA